MRQGVFLPILILFSLPLPRLIKGTTMKCILIIFALTLSGCSMEHLDGYTDYSIFTGVINE